MENREVLVGNREVLMGNREYWWRTESTGGEQRVLVENREALVENRQAVLRLVNHCGYIRPMRVKGCW